MSCATCPGVLVCGKGFASALWVASLPSMAFVDYLEQTMARLGMDAEGFAGACGLSPSVVFRWRLGYVPDIGNARKFAEVAGVPLLEVLVAAGRISEQEARGYSGR